MKLIRLSLCILLFCVTWSCSTSDENNIEVGLDSASEVVYDALFPDIGKRQFRMNG